MACCSVAWLILSSCFDGAVSSTKSSLLKLSLFGKLDVFMFDQSGFHGRADLNDRHRDMRLDVDNMSYEELLALEERIGYVNTGLCEHTILKCLKQWKYSPCKLEVAFAQQEPCCICREDYSEGEDIGTLNCRHDFHTACIKQWLMIKNLCPICKTAALVEGQSTISDGTK